MADGPSIGEAAIKLRDDNCRVSRERHKRFLDCAFDSSQILLSQQDKSYQCLNVGDNVDSSDNISGKNKSNNQLVVVMNDSLCFKALNNRNDCKNNNADDACESLDVQHVASNELASSNHSVASTNVTLLTSWTSMSIDPLAANADGPLVAISLVESLQEGSERLTIKEKSTGKGVCIKHKRKIEKMITAIVCGDSCNLGKEKQKETTKEKKGLSQGRVAATRLQGIPCKEQVKSLDDTLVGPCGKKRCADRYDSSESSDSGVAVSCGESSSSGTSDITEPGSPCSTSSDEGVGVRGTSGRLAFPSSSCKMAPSAQSLHNDTRPQWPWTPPLAATACTTYKRLKTEPEIGSLPKVGPADPTYKHVTKASGKSVHQHESQGKITEYFKTQVKPQQQKNKKTTEISVLLTKNSTEFRHPSTVQRNNKSGPAKYFGNMTGNRRSNSINDWNVRSLSIPPSPSKKSPLVVLPRSVVKLERKLPKSIPVPPISNDILSTMPSCKISSIRLISDSTSVIEKGKLGHNVSSISLDDKSVTIGFKDNIIIKPTRVNEKNNLSNNTVISTNNLLNLRPQGDHPLLRNSISPDHDKPSRDGMESKTSSVPILSTPTTIRFPAQTPDKDRSPSGDNGFCRWDKCEAGFETSGCLLEHLQTAHINTQTGGDNFVCHWEGCKVKGRTSCSRRWLERHVMSHGGNKPFRCIVDGCGSRFSSQSTLERHVNGHFNQPETGNSNGRRSIESSGKLMRRNGKRLRYRRQPWSARLFDYFDTGVMEGLQHRLLELAKSRTQGRLAETPGNAMILTSQIIARRVERDGEMKFLLRWHPFGIITDEWVSETEVRRTKYVEIRKVATLCPDEINLALHPAIKSDKILQARLKHRRKPTKNS